jgi:hypothetical protein
MTNIRRKLAARSAVVLLLLTIGFAVPIYKTPLTPEASAETSTCPEKRYKHFWDKAGRYNTIVQYCRENTWTDRFGRIHGTGTCRCA